MSNRPPPVAVVIYDRIVRLVHARKQHAKSLSASRTINLRGELLPFTRDINLVDRAPLEIGRIRDIQTRIEKRTELIGKLRDWIGNRQRDRSMSLSIRILHGGKILNGQLIALTFINLSWRFDSVLKHCVLFNILTERMCYLISWWKRLIF